MITHVRFVFMLAALAIVAGQLPAQLACGVGPGQNPICPAGFYYTTVFAGWYAAQNCATDITKGVRGWGWETIFTATNPASCAVQVRYDPLKQDGVHPQDVLFQDEYPATVAQGLIHELQPGQTRQVRLLAAADYNDVVNQNCSDPASTAAGAATVTIYSTCASAINQINAGLTAKPLPVIPVKEELLFWQPVNGTYMSTWDVYGTLVPDGWTGPWSATVSADPADLSANNPNARGAGVAIANPTATAETVELSLVDSSKTVVCTAAPITLGPNASAAGMLAGGLFPESCFPAGKHFEGHLVFTPSKGGAVTPTAFSIAGMAGTAAPLDFTLVQ